MKKTTTLKELRSKETKALFSELEAARKKLAELRFKASFRKLKNYQEINVERKKIAQIWTVLSENAIEGLKKKEVKNDR